MSLDSDIAQLTGTANALINTFEKKKSDIEQGITDALSSIPKFNKSFTVDQLNGNDSNDGTAESPLKSIPEVLRRTPFGGRAEVMLINDYNITERIDINGQFLRIIGQKFGESEYTKLNFVVGQVTSGPEVIPIYASAFGYLELYSLNVNWPDTTGVTFEGNNFALVGPRFSSDASSLFVKMTYVNISRPTNTVPMFAQTTCHVHFMASALILNSNMDGYWVKNVPAGSAVSTPPAFDIFGISNL